MGNVNQRMAQALLAFYDAHGRDLPWRRERDLYRIWLAEIMLQQTGVKSVVPYYERFLARFPDLASLAAGSREEVLALWQGLGYYRRAAHLHAAACRVAGESGGRLPESLAGLMSLPGIGESTAGAILAIGLGKRHPILDGNVKRVLARVLALEHTVDGKAGQQALWAMADRLTPADRPGDYAQAIMDLGAAVCRPRQPACACCPWSSWCGAALAGCPERFPRVASKGVKPNRYQFSLLVFREDGRVLLFPRPARGLLAGMWEPPGDQPGPVDTPPDAGSVSRFLVEGYGLRVTLPQPLEPVRHVFTHFRLTVFPFMGRWVGGEPPEASRWVAMPPDGTIPVSTLHRKVLARGWQGEGSLSLRQ
ncbi:MAG: A/G-specific adenine glycosylase [Magnetococcales bacterium]|nr:A/G-specific adenine glycosylase [Magnetococcales bacterium]